MADATVTLKFNPSEFRTIRFELEQQLQTLKHDYQTAVDGKWNHNPDGKALLRRQAELQALLESI